MAGMTNSAAGAAPPEVEDFDRNVSDVVRTLMAARRIATALELGDSVGIKRSTMSTRLTGATAWQGSEIKRLALYFGVDPAVFYEPVSELIPATSARRTLPETPTARKLLQRPQRVPLRAIEAVRRTERATQRAA